LNLPGKTFHNSIGSGHNNKVKKRPGNSAQSQNRTSYPRSRKYEMVTVIKLVTDEVQKGLKFARK